MIITCKTCKKEFLRKPSQIKRGGFCSRKCIQWKRGIGSPLFGKPLTEEAKKKMRIAKIGYIPSNKGKPMLEAQKEKIRNTLKIKNKGSGNPRWKGGISIGENLKGYFVIAAHKREALKKKVGGTYTLQEWESLKEKYGFMCLCCKREEPEIKLSADHIIPLSKGGTNDIGNIQPLCISCNCQKYTSVKDYRETFSQKQYA